MFLGEMGVGAALGGAAFYGAYSVSQGWGEGTDYVVAGCGFMGGAGSGVYLLGEMLDGRSANPWASLGAAMGGAALGTAVCTAPAMLLAKANDDENDSYVLVAIGVAAGVAGGTFTGAWFYNSVKERRGGGGARAPAFTPTVAVLAPRRGEDRPTLAYGVTWSF
jgi:hypothetical protein